MSSEYFQMYLTSVCPNVINYFFINSRLCRNIQLFWEIPQNKKIPFQVLVERTQKVCIFFYIILNNIKKFDI